MQKISYKDITAYFATKNEKKEWDSGGYKAAHGLCIELGTKTAEVLRKI